MKRRCADKSDRNYGGRGISVCLRWLVSVEAFYADVGDKPSPTHSLDRYPNKNGNYEPSNVRWATPVQQANNRRAAVSWMSHVLRWPSIGAAPGKDYCLGSQRLWDAVSGRTRRSVELQLGIRGEHLISFMRGDRSPGMRSAFVMERELGIPMHTWLEKPEPASALAKTG